MGFIVSIISAIAGVIGVWLGISSGLAKETITIFEVQSITGGLILLMLASLYFKLSELLEKQSVFLNRDDNLQKECPDCKESVHFDATICKHCGHKFTSEDLPEDIMRVMENFKTYNIDVKLSIINMIVKNKLINLIPKLVENLADNPVNDERELNNAIFQAFFSLGSVDCISLLVAKYSIRELTIDKQIVSFLSQIKGDIISYLNRMKDEASDSTEKNRINTLISDIETKKARNID